MRRIFLCMVVVGCGTEPGWWDPTPVPPEEEPEPGPPAWGVPITGGTMLATRDGNRVVIADPDRDRVMIFDFATETVVQTIALAAGSEPGRLVEDGDGRIHVALRRSGELLTITGTAHELRAVCGEPRGLAWDGKGDLVHVACSTGELVSMPAATGGAVRTVRVERDLRDVIVQKHGLLVTTFRKAELLQLDTRGGITTRTQLVMTQRRELLGDILLSTETEIPTVPATPTVAWRAIEMPDGRIVVSHQRKVGSTLEIRPGGYGSQCGSGPVESAISVVSARNEPFAVARHLIGALPVDVAVNPAGTTLAFVVAGTDSVQLIAAASLAKPDDDDDPCEDDDDDLTVILPSDNLGTPTSVAYRSNGALLVFYPERLVLGINTNGSWRRFFLGGDIHANAGRTLFHQQANMPVACASCHPEGRDDGQVWMFEELGARRTQSLGGSILQRAPYHWGGDMFDLRTLAVDVFEMRMSGAPVTDLQLAALGPWLDSIPAPKGVVTDAAAVERGKALFMSNETGCAGCHGGTLLTNNKLENVGTIGTFKVPSLLGVSARAPFLHDGCAATLRDRFGVCGGGDLHGHTSQLSDAGIADLVAYLESL